MKIMWRLYCIVDQSNELIKGHVVFDDGNRTERQLSEIALTQVLPTGLEIENLRLNGEELPSLTSSLSLSTSEYLDMRDDRINCFFDLYSKYPKKFRIQTTLDKAIQ